MSLFGTFIASVSFGVGLVSLSFVLITLGVERRQRRKKLKQLKHEEQLQNYAGPLGEDERQVRELVGTFSVREYASDREVREHVDKHLHSLRSRQSTKEDSQKQTDRKLEEAAVVEQESKYEVQTQQTQEAAGQAQRAVTDVMNSGGVLIKATNDQGQAVERFMDDTGNVAIARRHLTNAAVGSAPPVAKDVDYERILDAREKESHNWLTYYGDYDGKRYSLLDQINKDNVKKLTPAWVFQFGSQGLHAGPSTHAFEAAPIVVDGVMYVSGWDGFVWALDAKTGDLLWQYKHAIPFDVSLCCGNVNRGVAVGHGKVFMATLNAHVVAIDAESGEKVWDTIHGDVRAGESATVAPLLVKDMVIVGSSGGEFGSRGHLDAYNVKTGERVWRCYTIPNPGEPGFETWPEGGEQWQRGGGNCWVTGTFDPELNLLYWGTGNPAPDFDGEVRPGDNLFTDSVIAVNPDNGYIQWHYQFTPHDVWDYDSTMEGILFEKDGRKLLGHFDKNGYFFILDRTNGELVSVTPFVDRINWGEIDSDGKVTPSIYPEKEGEEVHFFPGPAGGKEWTHAAYSPKNELFYCPVQDTGSTIARRRREFREGIPYWGAHVIVDSDNMKGSVSAFDTDGQEVWRWENDIPMCASVLATAGDLVFAGNPQGEFNALDANTGEHLWKFQCGSGHHSSPTTYSVDGRQYVAVPVGWGAWVEGFLPGMMGGPHGSGIFVFALPE